MSTGRRLASPTMMQVSYDDNGPDGAAWKDVLAPYAEPRIERSLIDIATSVVPYLALTVGMYFLLDVSYVLVLVLAVPAAGFLVRTFILFHDCTHGSLLPSKSANTWLGRVLGIFVFQPFSSWRHDHAVHHATAGDLDRRGVGDVETLTVTEYYARRGTSGPAYWLFRNPLVMFGIGPIWALAIEPRYYISSKRPRVIRSVIGTEPRDRRRRRRLCLTIGWQAFLL